jgi:hypothetical protein
MRELNTAEGIWSHVAVGTARECWPYQGRLTTKGYGQFYFNGRRHSAHRVAYELAIGPVPSGAQLDHLCRNRACCNPSHLEPVSPKEDTRRSPIHNGAKTHCPHGHPYSAENTRRYRGSRYCRTCQNRPQSSRDGGPGCPGMARGSSASPLNN